MATDLTERGIGLELFQYRISEILLEQINDELDRQQELWVDRDKEWNDLTGQDLRVVYLEHFEPENIFRGHRPSLIESPPPEKFPNISVMAYMSRPLNFTDVIDQASNNNITVDIETSIKASSEAECDARKHRTVEAVHQVMTRNDRLQGISMGWDTEPVVQITDIYKRKEEGSYGDFWFFQMARLRYVAARHTNMPTWNIDQ